MVDVTISIALFDYVPVFLFGWAAYMLQRDFYGKMTKYAFACFAAGTIDAFIAGFLKATWKLLYAAGVCDFYVLNDLFLPLQSLGLLLAGLGVILTLVPRRKTTLSIAPPLFSGSFIFIAMMVVGLGAMLAGLSVFAVRMKKRSAVVLFVLAFLCCLGMGYLASRGGASAAANWIEESVNCVGQLFLLGGVLTLHKAGLRHLNI